MFRGVVHPGSGLHTMFTMRIAVLDFDMPIHQVSLQQRLPSFVKQRMVTKRASFGEIASTCGVGCRRDDLFGCRFTGAPVRGLASVVGQRFVVLIPLLTEVPDILR